MLFHGQAAQHCNCHPLCVKATLALCTSVLLFTPVDTHVPEKDCLSKGLV